MGKDYRVIPGPWKRNDFEISIVKNSNRAAEIINQVKSGELNPDDYVFNLDQVIQICASVAGGFWDNASIVADPCSKWGREQRGKQIREAIKMAFTVKKT